MKWYFNIYHILPGQTKGTRLKQHMCIFLMIAIKPQLRPSWCASSLQMRILLL
jgi:hypothetical protein